ncbi:hypothetical protein CPB84DRAFT_1771864 [Gymnopilus junonius]|uniref:Uncharacterized protein n=1 Tax=Gymnopilus junonius TaxID=109634 RepID=A0A9P5NV44_GYMJU|nr:hypothetical protein CPB84DRAFT_1771864 [Gymnopilus junonius]
MDELQKVKPHLAWITLRNLVDKVQAKLAMTAGLVDGDPSYNHSVHQRSLIWRKKLGGVNHRDDKERMRIAQSLFSGPKTNGSSASTAALCFLHSSGGHLVTDIVSEMRQRGDEIAHSRLTLRDVTQAIDCIEMTAEREEGIKALANFLNLY